MHFLQFQALSSLMICCVSSFVCANTYNLIFDIQLANFIEGNNTLITSISSELWDLLCKQQLQPSEAQVWLIAAAPCRASSSGHTHTVSPGRPGDLGSLWGMRLTVWPKGLLTTVSVLSPLLPVPPNKQHTWAHSLPITSEAGSWKRM